MATITEDRLAEIRQRLNSGDYLTAYDEAAAVLEAGDEHPALIHLAVLSLARSGATDQAIALLSRYRTHLPDDEEIGALEARLFKDQYFACPDEAKKITLGKRARDAYLRVFENTRGYFSGINAATLSCLIGDVKNSHRLASEVYGICQTNPSDDYWHLATMAECCLVLERDAEAQSFLKTACEAETVNPASLSTTFRQLRLICEARGIGTELIASIRPPAVIHYTGHMIHGIGRAPGMDSADEPMLRQQVAAALEAEQVGFAYGSLACGADLIVAEQILQRGAELHVILPFSTEDFRHISVSPGGTAWEMRYDHVLDQATSVVHLVQDVGDGADFLFHTVTLQAIGRALLKAGTLGSKVMQIALWNGLQSSSSSGTAADIRLWKNFGLESMVITVPAPRSAAVTPASAAGNGNNRPEIAVKRRLMSMIFADVKGYSKLSEYQIAFFVPRWLNRLASLITAHTPHVIHTETWGDAIYLVLDSVSAAADAAIGLSGLFQDTAWHDLGLPHGIGVRVSAHVGPVFVADNPVLGKKAYFGPDVTRTARMEPCTPVGSVYVTEAFAAALAVESAAGFRCEYAGNQPLAKEYGSFPMYQLRRR